MSKLDELRARAKDTELKRLQMERIRESVKSTIDSSGAWLSMLDQMQATSDSKDELVETIVSSVTEVTNKQNVFIDACKAKGMSDYKIKEAVESLNKMFDLAGEDASYEDKLEAVALYMDQYPHLYRDIAMLV